MPDPERRPGENEREQTQQRSQALEQSVSAPERARELLNDNEKRVQGVEASLDRLKERYQNLLPSAAEKERSSLQREINRQEQELAGLEDRGETLARIERNYGQLDDRLQKLADGLLDRIEQGEDLGRRWVASPDAQSEVAQKSVLTNMQRDLDANANDPDRALQTAADQIRDFEQRGYFTAEMSEVRDIMAQDQNSASKLDQLRDKLAELEQTGVMNSTSLEKNGKGLFIADVPELAQVWQLAKDELEARDRDPGNYDAVRKEFWNLLNPQTERPWITKEQRQDIEAGREFIEQAGYTFEASRPGAAPRLVADNPLSRNDYTLSLQHEFAQHQAKAGNLEDSLTAADNLRFVTTRDNLHEDSVRFRSFMAGLNEQAKATLGELTGILKDASEHFSQSGRDALKQVEKDARAQLSETRDWERDALKQVGAEFDTLRDLRTQIAVEERSLMEAPFSPGSAEFEGQRHELTLLQERNHSAEQLVAGRMIEAARAFAEQLNDVEMFARDEEVWARVRREIAERIAELWREHDIQGEPVRRRRT